MHCVWQEAWTSSPFARSRFIRGKLVYQRDPSASTFFARPYEYRDGLLTVPAGVSFEELVVAAMPTDELQCSAPGGALIA